MKTKSLQILAVVWFVITNMNCSKTPPPEVVIQCDSSNTALIPDDMKARFYFKEGTWWVYKNVASNEFDTIRVQNFYHQIGTPSKNRYGDEYAQKCYEYLEYHILSQKYGSNRITIESTQPLTQMDKTKEAFLLRDDYTKYK